LPFIDRRRIVATAHASSIITRRRARARRVRPGGRRGAAAGKNGGAAGSISANGMALRGSVTSARSRCWRAGARAGHSPQRRTPRAYRHNAAA
jgi:hypothetical protein